ncbi:MAG: hypothetical protein ABIH26_00405 [Candidatus Eisenbacteria bacterium]
MDERVGNHREDTRRTGPVRKEAYSVDLEALRSASRRGLPAFSETSRSLIESIENRRKRGAWMGLMRGIIERPRLATVLVGGALAAVMLFVPISYERTVGHEVAFTLSGMSPGAEAVSEIAKEMKSAIGADRVGVRMAVAAGGTSGAEHTLTARVPDGSHGRVERLAASYAAVLAKRGAGATFSVSPVRDLVRSNVYLAAANSIINIRVGDRSADEIADDIRWQLESAGVVGAEVDVSTDEGCARICVRASAEGNPELPEIQCETEGEADQKCLRLELRRTPEMTDADLIADIERQLAEQGLSGTVTLDGDGCPKVELDE